MRDTLPRGVIGPVLQRRLRRRLRLDLRAVGRRLQLRGAAGLRRRRAPAPAARARTWPRSRVFGAQDEKLFIEISQKRLAQLGLDFNQVIAQLGAQNAVEGAGAHQCRRPDICRCAWPAQFDSRRGAARACRSAPSSGTGVASSLRLGDIAEIRRAYDRPAAGEGAPPGQAGDRARRLDGQGRRHHRAGQGAASSDRRDSRRDLPAGIELRAGAGPAGARCRARSASSCGVLIEAIVDRAGGELHQPGPAHQAAAHRPRGPAWWWASRSRWCWRSPSSTMYYWGVGLHKISLGSLIIALGLLVDDAIIAVEMMVREARRGLRQGARRHLRLRGHGDADADRHADHRGGLPADRPGQVGRPASTPSRSSRSPSAALLISWLVVGLLRAVPRRACCSSASRTTPSDRPHELFDTPFYQRFRALVNWCVQHRWITIGADRADLRARRGRHGQGAAAVLSRFEPARDPGRPVAARGLDHPARPRSSRAASSSAMMKEPGVETVSVWIGSGVPRFYLPLDQIFPQSQRQPDHPAGQATSSSARRCASACPRCWPRSFRRCAVASSCCPTGRRCRIRCSSA